MAREFGNIRPRRETRPLGLRFRLWSSVGFFVLAVILGKPGSPSNTQELSYFASLNVSDEAVIGRVIARDVVLSGACDG